MNNSININHLTNSITPFFDGLLFEKENDVWKDISKNCLYKKINQEPKNDFGNNNDYYVNLEENYNLCIYSNDFSKNVWINDKLILSEDDKITFPKQYTSTKIIPNNQLSEHCLSYIVENISSYNPLTYYFSIFSLYNEYHRISLSILDKDEKYGIRVIFNLLTKEKLFEYVGINPDDDSTLVKYGITKDEISQIDYDIIEDKDEYCRLYIAAHFKTTNYLKMKINVIDNENNIIFANNSLTNGLFINGAQISTNKLNNFNYTNGEEDFNYSIKSIYKKDNDEWKTIPESSTLLILNDIPTSDIGNNNDIAIINSLLELSPIVKFGSAENIEKFEGLIYFNEEKNTYCVVGKRGEYELMFSNSSPHTKEMLMSLSLNNKTYQQWDAKHYSIPNFNIGYNTGSHSNFWNDNKLLPKRF